MLIYIPLQSKIEVLKSVSATATYLAKKKLYAGILEKNKLKSLRHVSPSVKKKVMAEFKKKWKEFIRVNKSNRKPVVALSPKQQAYREHFRTLLTKYGATSPTSLGKEERSKFFSELKSTWKSNSAGMPLNSSDEYEPDDDDENIDFDAEFDDEDEDENSV